MKTISFLLLAGLLMATFQNCGAAATSKGSTSITGESLTDGEDSENTAQIFFEDIDPSVEGIAIQQRPPGLLSFASTEIFFKVGLLRGQQIVSVSCSFNASQHQDCESPLQLRSLSDGDYSMSIRVEDQSGNTSEVEFAWQVDLQPRPLVLTGIPFPETSISETQFSFATQDLGSGIGTIECRIDDNDFEPCVSPVIYENVPAGDHIFEVRRTGEAGDSDLLRQSWTQSP